MILPNYYNRPSFPMIFRTSGAYLAKRTDNKNNDIFKNDEKSY
jgi:hypothetical protein